VEFDVGGRSRRKTGRKEERRREERSSGGKQMRARKFQTLTTDPSR
jgi:hypothetical protein